MALAAFDFAQNAAGLWKGSKIEQERRILESVSLNRTLSDASPCLEERKPFSLFAERPSIQTNRGDWI